MQEHQVDILQIHDEAKSLCRRIMDDLPAFFGIPEANEQYASGVLKRINFAARYQGALIGLLCLDFPYPHNASIYWMGVMKQYQGQGIGRALLAKALEYSHSQGAETMTVETLSPLESDENYRKTFEFYHANGFVPLFDLRPQGYEWNMVYMAKTPLNCEKTLGKDIQIRSFSKIDIYSLVEGFKKHNWNKPESAFENYLEEQEKGLREVWVAYVKNEMAGYVTLNWQSNYWPFSANSIPEITDLNVLPPFRRLGIASGLLDWAEESASKKSSVVGIGVGLYDGYGPAQKLYVKRGYIPDGRGPTYRYTKLEYGQTVLVDDDLVFWFSKSLTAQRKAL